MQQLKGSLARPLPRYLSAETRVLDSTTRLEPRIDPISEAAARLVKSARKEIFIQNPYVVALRETIEIFSAASEQGVPIVLLTNSPASSDSKVMQAFFLEQWPYLLASIPTMQLYGNGADQKLHAKLASFDKVLSLVGTYNLSPLSMAINSEIVIAVWSSEFAEKLTGNPRARLAAGEPKTYRYRIVRNEDGTPKRDEDGKPIVEFGPEDHTDVESMIRLRVIQKDTEGGRYAARRVAVLLVTPAGKTLDGLVVQVANRALQFVQHNRNSLDLAGDQRKPWRPQQEPRHARRQ
jgi:cardiolipin synthase C